MQVNIDSPSALRRKLTIEVEPDEIKRELDKAYNELKRRETCSSASSATRCAAK
jgi:FKBP-type peptidyl-prolyl cis-trans isomerase (trigger factor)